LDKGGFKLKEWTYSGDRSSGDKTKIAMEPSAATEKVLGVVWDPIRDNFQFKVKLSFSPKRKLTLIRKDMTAADIHTPDVLTKHMILPQVNSIYDPLGLAGPYTVRAKTLMRKLWTNKNEIGLGRPHTIRKRARAGDIFQ